MLVIQNSTGHVKRKRSCGRGIASSLDFNGRTDRHWRSYLGLSEASFHKSYMQVRAIAKRGRYEFPPFFFLFLLFTMSTGTGPGWPCRPKGSALCGVQAKPTGRWTPDTRFGRCRLWHYYRTPRFHGL